MKDEMDFCPYCGNNTKIEIIEKTDKMTLCNREISFKSHFYYCPVCKRDFQTMEQMDESLVLAQNAYEEQYKNYNVDKLVAIRQKYNVSQKTFGAILGFGELTINSYEHGKVPSSTNRMLLALSEDSYCFYKMYEINKNKLSSLQRKKIEENEGFQTWTKFNLVTENLLNYTASSNKEESYENSISYKDNVLETEFDLDIAA